MVSTRASTQRRSAPVEALCRRVFFLEGVLMLLTGGLMVVAPNVVLDAQGTVSVTPATSWALAQFGAMVVLMGYVGVLAPVHPRVVQACLLGDVLWAYTFWRFVETSAAWTFGSMFSFGITVFLAVTRTTYLLAQRTPART